MLHFISFFLYFLSKAIEDLCQTSKLHSVMCFTSSVVSISCISFFITRAPWSLVKLLSAWLEICFSRSVVRRSCYTAEEGSNFLLVLCLTSLRVFIRIDFFIISMPERFFLVPSSRTRFFLHNLLSLLLCLFHFSQLHTGKSVVANNQTILLLRDVQRNEKSLCPILCFFR